MMEKTYSGPGSSEAHPAGPDDRDRVTGERALALGGARSQGKGRKVNKNKDILIFLPPSETIGTEPHQYRPEGLRLAPACPDCTGFIACPDYGDT